MCKFVRPAPIIKLILTNSDRQRQASLWPVATTCAAATNTTRHGVTQATRYAYDPTGRCVAKSDAFCSIHYLWDGDLTVHSQRGTRQALYIYEPGSFVPLATIQGAGRRAQHLLVPVRPDRSPLDHRRTGPRGLGRTTAHSWTTGRGISLRD